MRGNGKSTRRLTSWIESYVEYSSATPAPEIFRLWSAIGTLGSALERRAYVTVANQITFPNLFVLLVGRPGVGKSNAINPASAILKATGNYAIAPRDTTKASFLKWMASDEARQRNASEVSATLEESHSVSLQVSELGVFIRSHELDVLSLLCDLYDCPPEYENKRIYQGKDQINIPNPQVSILAGTQPGYLAAIFPTEAWVQGFMARVILIHSGEPSRPSLFDSKPLDRKLEAKLVADLAELKHLSGEFTFTPEAKTSIEAWYSSGMNPVPTYPRLETYNTRRIVHLLKLLQISCASRSNSMEIELEDFEIAQDWMLSAEKAMPDVFKEMAGRSDQDVLRGLWHYAWVNWEKSKKSMHHTRLMGYLSAHVPAWSADKILTMAVAAGYFKKEGKDLYTPQPKQDWGQV